MPEQHSGESISIMRVQPREPSGVILRSESQGVDGRLDERHSALGGNLSPPLEWDPVIDARAWAIIVEDPDAPRDLPFLHWMAWDIPGEVTTLPQGLSNDAHPLSVHGMIQGRNDNGSYGWFGPKPPPGHGVHHYHFQIFALDGPLGLGADSPLEALIGALKGHTLAEGQLVATFEAPATQ